MATKKEFNNLERAILQWFEAHYKDEHLTAQINAAKLKNRRWTKVGFYVDLDIPSDVATVDVGSLKHREPLRNDKSVRKGWPIGGPEIKSKNVEDGGGSLLWGKAGRITTIEMYSYGHSFAENVTEFELK